MKMKTVSEIRVAIGGNRNREIEDEYIRRAYELGFAEGGQFGAGEMIEASAQRYENET